MKSVKTLIKLQQRQLDDRRRALKQLQDEEDRLKAKKEALKKSIMDERERAAADMQAAFTLPAFTEDAKSKIEKTEEEIVVIKKGMEVITREIAEIFGELKRYEIYDEMKEAEARLEQSKQEQKDMDEMGLRGFVYKD